MEINKYKKFHKIKRISKQEKFILTNPQQGFYALRALETGFITPEQLESSRRIISRITKRSGKILLKVKFAQALTKKPLLSRMGKGCGSFDRWISYLKKGKIILELKGVPKKLALAALKAVCKRLPTRFEILQREIIDV